MYKRKDQTKTLKQTKKNKKLKKKNRTTEIISEE